jgi:hypothetical protein
MKKLLSCFAALILLSGIVYADDIAYKTLVPKSAISMALGGVFSSVPTSAFSFFGNPAAFASKKTTYLLPTVDAWAYFRPTAGNIGSLIDNANSSSSLLPAAFSLMAQNGGVGAGASAGLGYAGKGLGLGFFVTSDNFAEGTSPAGASVSSDTEVTGIVGLGFPIHLGSLDLSVGGDLRPFYHVRIHELGQADVVLADLIDGSGSLYSDSFFGVVMDLGAMLKLGDFTVGLSVHDIAPSFPIATSTIAQLQSSLSSGSLPSTSSATDTAVFTPDIAAGLSWAPKLLPGYVEPSLYFEMQDPITVIRQWSGIGSALNLLHAGGEVKLLNFIMLRGGLNRGWLSAGAGVKLFFLDLNAAVFTEELGSLPGDRPRSGLAIQAAIRF